MGLWPLSALLCSSVSNSEGIVFRRQILTSKDVPRTERVIDKASRKHMVWITGSVGIFQRPSQDEEALTQCGRDGPPSGPALNQHWVNASSEAAQVMPTICDIWRAVENVCTWRLIRVRVHETLNQWWVNFGPPSTTSAQH